MAKHLATILAFWATIIVAGAAFGQNIQPYIAEMSASLGRNTTYGTVGSVELVDNHFIHFLLTVPGPTIALPVGGGATAQSTRWSTVALDFMSITADLKSLDEDHITEHPAFSADGLANYRPGDEGDLTVVQFKSTDAPSSISVTTCDREKVTKLPRGASTATATQLGAETKTVEGAVLVFTDRNSARAFEKALRVAIVVAKSQ